MKFQGSRSYFLIPFLVLVLSQIMCKLPMSEEESLNLAEELFGLEVGEGLVYEVDVNVEKSQQEDLCLEYELPHANRIESFKFGKAWGRDTLTVISPDGKLLYKSEDAGLYCRNITPYGKECISPRGRTSYVKTLNAYSDSTLSIDSRKHCYVATHNLTLTNQEMPGSEVSQDESGPDQNSEPEGNGVQADNQAVLFSSDDCSFCGLSIPLSSSSASNNTYKMGVTSEVQVEVTGHLTCDWQGDYKSENKTGTIMIYLNVYKFDNVQDAQILFNKFHNNAVSMMGYCNKDDSCTVAIAEFGEDRAYYVWENIYVGGKGELPSDHGANLARLITTAEKYYVLDLLVTHPELEIGNAWVSDTAESVEACVMNIINW